MNCDKDDKDKGSHRDWVFTCFNVDKYLEFDENNIRYICYGREQCPTSGREHYQGFAICKRTCRIPKFQQWTGIGKSHCQSRRGTRDEARDYCRKSDGEFFEWGEFESLTKEDYFKKPIEWIKENKPEFYCRYHKGLEKLQVRKSPKWREVTVTWLWGEGGTGKTREALNHEDVYKLDRPYDWFCGYEQESRLVLDDVCAKDFTEKRGLFLNLFDGHPLRLPVKGAHTYAHWTEVYVTSNFDPEKIMIHPEWCRRINVVRRVTL